MNSLVYLFEETVRSYSDNIAIKNKNKDYSYKETNSIANKIARYLQYSGIRKGDNVGIYIEKSEYVLFLILALLKLGASYVPIDPKSPPQRVKHIIKNSELKLLISDVDRVDNQICKHLSIDNLLVEYMDFSSENLHVIIAPEDPAYIIFTSGSTGIPKGVCVSHENVVNLFSASKELFNFNDKDKWTFFHSYAFDFSVWEMWGAWAYGGTVTVISFAESRNPVAFVNLMVDTQTSIFNCTPSAFFEMSEEIIKRQHELNLKYIIFGGEALNFKKLTSWFLSSNTNLPKLINMYGITETTVHVTYKEVTKDDVKKGITNIGKVLPHLGFKVMNQTGKEVKINEEGELYVSGKGVSLGYYKNSEMNEKKFISIDNVRYYKSGDIVKVLNNDELQYISRNDDQVQLRGFRIELGEIESTYNNVKQIRNAVVKADTVFNDDIHLILYYVSDEELTDDYLKESVRSSLPTYMIPSFFIKIDKIPLTINGKINKLLLPKVATNKDYEPELFSNDTLIGKNAEKIVKQIVVKVTGDKLIGIDQSLLKSGMNSLLIMRLIMQIKNLFNIDLIPSEIMENDTISKLAQFISTRKSQGASQGSTPIKINHKKIYPLTYEQENLWFIYQTNKDKALYNTVFSYDISGAINKEKLQLALNKMSVQHQILKSVIKEDSGKGSLFFDDSIYHYIEFIDLSDVFIDQEKQIDDLVEKEVTRQFDLESGPLLSITLVKKNKGNYQLICNIHHIIFDGWSIPLLVEGWFNIYESLEIEESSQGRQHNPLQYGDYALWQKNSLTYIQEKDEDFWRNELATISQKSLLQYDYPKTIDSNSDSNIVRFSVPKEVQNNLNNLNKKTRSTLFMSLLTAYQTFLSAYLDEKEVIVGSPLAKRNHVDSENIIGYFVNTLPFKLNISKEDSFEEILIKNIKNITNVFDHQDLPTEKILKHLPFDRNIDSSLLFDTVFVLQNNQKAKLTYQALKLKPKKINTFKAKFDLVVEVEELNNELSISFEYKKALFNKNTIERMASNFKHWLQEITMKTDERLIDLSYIEPEQLQTIIKMSTNKVECETKNNLSFKDVITRFEKTVSMNPKDIAIVHGTSHINYEELNSRANQIAHWLFQNKVTVEDKIGVFMDRSIDMITAVLAIMKVGAGYVPLDPSQPESRLKYMIEDSEIIYCLTNDENKLKYPGERTKLLLVEEKINELQGELVCFSSVKLSKGNLAYIIYTSGTTGKPKGVMIEHGGLANLCDWHTNYYSLTQKDAASLASNTSFDASIWEIFPYLTNGNKLTILDYYDLLDVEVLSEKLEQEHISLAFFSTGLLEQLFINKMKFPKSIRALLTGGDRLKTIPNHLEFDLYNNYGPTEGTVVSTSCKITPNNDAVIPIGKPILNVEAYVFNSNMKLTPIGQTGELYIGGKGVARGYINNEEKTRENFIRSPFAPSERLYKTGDLVRYTEEGNLLFVGRVDDQVKIRGFRIELGEINAVLKNCQGIKDCVVTIRDELNSKKAILAYYISDMEIDDAHIRKYMKTYLPDYMIPSFFMKMDSFPLTANGKVDIRSLPALKVSNKKTPTKKYISNTEEKLLKIWKKVLKNQKITTSDNFFECGGDSILSIQICSLAKKENLFITTKDIFEKQTIEELTQIVELKSNLRISQSEVYGKVSLTPIQSWFFNQHFENINHWNQSVTLIGYPLLTLEKLKKIICYIVGHHDGLRSEFYNKELFSTVEKNIKNKKFWNITFVDLSSVDNKVKEQEIIKLENAAQKAINIAKGPMMQVVCIKTEENNHRIIWIIHHLIVDGVSWRILIEDFNQLYLQDLNNQELKLSNKTTSFKEWANKLNSYKNEIPKEIKEYWLQECTKLSDDILIKGDDIYDGKSFKIELDAETTEKIYNVITKLCQASPDEIYLSLFSRIIGKYFNKKEIPITLEGHGREEVIENIDLSRTIGWFTTMYPIYLKCKESLSKTIKETKRKLRGIPNKGIEYGILAQFCGEKYLPKNKPAISFNNLGKFSQSDEICAKEVIFLSENDIQQNSYTTHDIDLELLLVEDKQIIKINYNKNFVGANFENYIYTELLELLESFGEETEKTSKSLNILEQFPIFQGTEGHKSLLCNDLRIIDIYDLTHLQKGMLYHSLFNRESQEYKVQLIFEIKGSLNILEMKDAINATIKKHDILKTKFYSDKKGIFHQVVMDELEVEVQYRELPYTHMALENLLTTQYRNIDIENNKLNNFLIIKQANNDYLLIWTFHHILMDGWSYSMVIKDVFNYYHSKRFSSDRNASFKSYIEYMKDYTQQAKLKKYWSEKLQNYSILQPNLIHSFQSEEHIEGCYSKQIDEELSTSIQKFCQKYRITINTFFLTIWLSTLKEIKGTESVCCGVVTSGRNVSVKHIDEIVGPIINTVPFIKKVTSTSSYEELLKEVQTEFLELRDYENTPLSKIYEWTNIKSPLFDSLYAFENYPIDLPSTEEMDVKLKEGREKTHYPIVIIINPGSNVQIKFNESVIDEKLRNSFIKVFNQILDKMLQKIKVK
ncbi:amino acid adenylation domain-containing protein [Priestia aryabhattai]